MNLKARVFLLTAAGLTVVLAGDAVGASPPRQDAKDVKSVPVEVVAAWSQDDISVSGMNQAPGEGQSFVVIFGKPKGQKGGGAFHVAARDDKGAVIGFRSAFNEGGVLESSEAVLMDPAGGRYLPIGGLSGSFAFFRSRSLLSREIRVEIPASGDATFALIYEVPKGRSGYRLSVAQAEPIMIDMDKK